MPKELKKIFGKFFAFPNVVFKNKGYCVCCEKKVTFIANGEWFRDLYRCSNCGCIPRERALMYCVEKFAPNWRRLIIHESSPVKRGASLRLSNEAKNYIPSQYYPDVQPGIFYLGCQCENLEHLTFEDNSIDLHITQDVMEHIFDPQKAFQEIARTLKPGGMHIFTVPLVNKNNPTLVTAKLDDNHNIVHFVDKPDYHGNSFSNSGSLVTHRWGYDICEFIFRETGLFTEMVYMDAIDLGIRAELIEVLITRKH